MGLLCEARWTLIQVLDTIARHAYIDPMTQSIKIFISHCYLAFLPHLPFDTNTIHRLSTTLNTS